MAQQQAPDLSHLSGSDLERVATALTSGSVRAVLEQKDAIKGLNTSEISNLERLISAGRANCGGIGCG